MANCGFPLSKSDRCKRPRSFGKELCVFHLGKHEASLEIFDLIKAGDGDWRYFKFPSGLNFSGPPNMVPPTIKFPIDLEGAEINGLKVEGITFEESVNFANARIDGKTLFFAVKFKAECELANTTLASVDLHQVKFENKLPAIGMRCTGDFRFRGTTGTETNFHQASFEGAADFVGSRTIHQKLGSGGQARSDTINYCLSGEVQFTDVKFFNPNQSIIRLADFRNTHIMGTNFEGVSLVDIVWPIGKVDKRRKIYDDLWATESDDVIYGRFAVERIESQYRNLRRAYEMQKNFSAAHDFYVGEMESKLRGDLPPGQRLVLNFYRLSSYYGTGPVRALLVFVILAFLYGTLSGFASDLKLTALSTGGIQDFPELLWKLLVRTFENLIVGFRQLIPGGPKIEGGAVTAQIFFDVTFRVLGALQFAMLVITFRNMVKRG